MTVVDQVENVYRTHLGWALPGAREVEGQCVDAFVVAQRALEANAWQGGRSVEFSGACAAKQAAADSAAGECVSALETHFRAEPLQVPRTDRRSRFY